MGGKTRCIGPTVCNSYPTHSDERWACVQEQSRICTESAIRHAEKAKMYGRLAKMYGRLAIIFATISVVFAIFTIVINIVARLGG